jgi:hypothetical protein
MGAPPSSQRWRTLGAMAHREELDKSSAAQQGGKNGSIVEICNDATGRGGQLTGDEIHTRLIERYPLLQEGLIAVAFPRAAEKLQKEAERDSAEADELRQYSRQRQGPSAG